VQRAIVDGDNMDLALIAVAKFVRDLLTYNEQLIKIGRDDDEMLDFNQAYIVVDVAGQRQQAVASSNYNGSTEVMRYIVTEAMPVTVDFFGAQAYTNANTFRLLMQSERRLDLQAQHGITVYNVSRFTDLKLLTGGQYRNRYQLEFAVRYNSAVNIPTLRIDSVEIQTVLTDK
jgi:hypothetical protein